MRFDTRCRAQGECVMRIWFRMAWLYAVMWCGRGAYSVCAHDISCEKDTCLGECEA